MSIVATPTTLDADRWRHAGWAYRALGRPALGGPRRLHGDGTYVPTAGASTKLAAQIGT